VRILHTADWHLGRTLHLAPLLEDQARVLDDFVAVAREERPDAVVVAGDVYDRGIPPNDAVRLLDDVLSRLVLGLGLRVILVAGNHDSPERLGFGSRLLERGGLVVAGLPQADPAPVELRDEHGAVHLYALPYLEPVRAREIFVDEEIRGHDRALRALLDRVRAGAPAGRLVAAAHAFVAGGEGSESERPLSVGGAGSVGADAFAGFAYVALGHLHRPQTVAGRLRYAGSLLTYSFSEIGHRKSATLAEIDGAGRCVLREIPFSPRREVRELRGCLAEIVAAAGTDPRSDDYLRVVLEDRVPILDPMGKLRQVYPNVLELGRVLPAGGPGASAGVPQDRRELGEVELFEAFYREVAGEEVGAEQRQELATLVDELHADVEGDRA
jgi:exonuclease SbcD